MVPAAERPGTRRPRLRWKRIQPYRAVSAVVIATHNAILDTQTAEGGEAVDLHGKKVIAIGERDGVQATAIAAVARSAGAEVLLELNQCFV